MPHISRIAPLAPAAIVSTLLTGGEIHAQKPGTTPITEIISNPDFALKDHHGKDFNPAKVFAGKPYIVVFGFQDGEVCSMCDKIGTNLGRLQQALRDHGKEETPVLVVDVLGAKDAKNAKVLIERYYQNGVTLHPGEGKKLPKDLDERAKMGAAAFEADAENPPAPEASKRVLHLVYPPTSEHATNMQKQLKAQFFDITGRFPKKHSKTIAVVNADGICSVAELGIVEDPKGVTKLMGLLENAATVQPKQAAPQR